MIVRYFNNQYKSDPINGATFANAVDLAALLDSEKDSTPFIAELRGDNEFELVFGIGADLGFVEHRRINGDLPYLMAVSTHPLMQSGHVDFLTANTPTPIAAHYILSFDELKQIALYFFETGERSRAVLWEAV